MHCIVCLPLVSSAVSMFGYDIESELKVRK